MTNFRKYLLFYLRCGAPESMIDLVICSIGMWVPNMMSSWCSVSFLWITMEFVVDFCSMYTLFDRLCGPVGGRIVIGTCVCYNFFMVMWFDFVSSMTHPRWDSSQNQWWGHVFLQSWLDLSDRCDNCMQDRYQWSWAWVGDSSCIGVVISFISSKALSKHRHTLWLLPCLVLLIIIFSFADKKNNKNHCDLRLGWFWCHQQSQ